MEVVGEEVVEVLGRALPRAAGGARPLQEQAMMELREEEVVQQVLTSPPGRSSQALQV